MQQASPATRRGRAPAMPVVLPPMGILAAAADVGKTALKLLLRLHQLAGVRGVCEATDDELGHFLGKCEKTVQRAFVALELVGLVERVRRYGRRTIVLRYTLSRHYGPPRPTPVPAHAPSDSPAPEVTAELVARGVSADVAGELTRAASDETIRSKLRVFDWLKERGDARVGRNAPGYLVASIREDYIAPDDYLAERAKQAGRAAARVAEEERRREADRRREEERQRSIVEQELHAEWDGLAADQRAAIEARVRAENPTVEGLPPYFLRALCIAALEVVRGGPGEDPG